MSFAWAKSFHGIVKQIATVIVTISITKCTVLCFA